VNLENFNIKWKGEHKFSINDHVADKAVKYKFTTRDFALLIAYAIAKPYANFIGVLWLPLNQEVLVEVDYVAGFEEICQNDLGLTIQHEEQIARFITATKENT